MKLRQTCALLVDQFGKGRKVRRFQIRVYTDLVDLLGANHDQEKVLHPFQHPGSVYKSSFRLHDMRPWKQEKQRAVAAEMITVELMIHLRDLGSMGESLSRFTAGVGGADISDLLSGHVLRAGLSL